MKETNIKNWVMIGLLAIIIVVLLTQPIIVTEVVTENKWVTTDGKWEITEPQHVHLNESEAILYDQSLISINGDIATYYQYAGGDYTAYYRNLKTNVNEPIYPIDGAWQFGTDSDDGVIVFECNLDWKYDVYNIYKRDLNEGTVNMITNNTYNDRRPRISDNNVVFLRNGVGLMLKNNEATEILIDADVDSYNYDIDGNYVAYRDYQGFLKYYDIEKDAVVPLGMEMYGDVGIADSHITYTKWDYGYGNYVGGIYDIEAHEHITIHDENMDMTRGVKYLGEDLVCVYATKLGTSYLNVYLVDLSGDAPEETYTYITNDANLKMRGDACGEYVSWGHYTYIGGTRQENPPNSDTLYYVTYSAVTESDEIPIAPEMQETYNYDVIYTVAILGTILGMVATLFIVEYAKDKYNWND